MIFEVLSSVVMGGLALHAHLSKNNTSNDSKKLNKVFSLSGLNVKDGNQTYTAHLVKKKNYEWGTEYRYRIPLGRSPEDYMSKLEVIKTAINQRQVKLQLKDFRELKFDKNFFNQFKSIYDRKLLDNKEVDISYDGLLKIRIYNSPFPRENAWTEALLKEGTWQVIIGSGRKGNTYHDFDKRKHLIIAGATGFGKSVIMKSIITCLILSKPNDVSFSLIDLKGGAAFSRFKNTKQVINFGTNNEGALEILKSVQLRMNRSYEKIVNDGYEDVSEAGISERHFLFIDEAADLTDDKECMEILTNIVRKGRGAGFYVVYATQYPSAQAIPMQIKRNIPARLCFVLDSATASMTVLDAAGAESLPEIPGRGIYKEVSQTILQTPYMANKTIEQLLKPYIIDKTREVSPSEKTTHTETGSHTVIIEETRLS
ncbi:FtsK/SpoIIIE domain-containing protein [Bacillus sp. JJ722]|uniref:FtsK/SpoIIIE domain-containing protein n=1 Tax=Bacillus sp. JJ722 TaxID=3122973 RepID=UPI002FFE7DF3